MMEQTHAGKRHGNAVFVAGFDNVVVPDGAARLGNEFHAAAVRALDVIPKGEERIRAEGNAGHLVEPGALFLPGKRLRLHGEKLLPDTVSQHIHVIVGNINVNRVIAVRAADVFHKGKREHLRVLA